MNVRSIAVCSLVALLCSCTSTSVKQTWKSPDRQASPFTRFAVLAVDERIDVRKAFELRMIRDLRNAGAWAVTTFDRLSLTQINQDKPAAAERLRADGAETLVLIRLKDVASSYRESRPGSERYAEVITGMEMGTWYDYYSVAFADLSPTYGNLKQKVYLETSLYDLKTAKRLWSGLTQTVVTETMDRLAELDPITAKFVAAMRKDGMVP